MQQTWYVDVAGYIFFDENFRPRCVKTFIIQCSIRSFHTFLRISRVYLNMSTHSKGDPPVDRHGIPLKRYLTWNPDVFQAKASKKKPFPPSLLFQNNSSPCQRLFTKLLFSINDLQKKSYSPKRRFKKPTKALKYHRCID